MKSPRRGRRPPANQVFIGIRSQASGVRRQASGVRRQESGVRRQASGVRRQASGVRRQESGVRSQVAGISGTFLGQSGIDTVCLCLILLFFDIERIKVLFAREKFQYNKQCMRQWWRFF